MISPDMSRVEKKVVRQKTVENYDHYLSKFFECSKITKPNQITEELVRISLAAQPPVDGNNRAWSDASGRGIVVVLVNEVA